MEPAGLDAGLSGRYEIERELGSGGMAVVFLARDLRHGRKVALKVLRQEIRAADGVERFHREIRMAAGLVHPHILPLLESGGTEGQLWYTMPFVEGESLRDRLTREKQLPVDEALRLTREVAAALGHAHAKGILHRDIKPENILLADGHALVADFGIARAVGGDGSERITSTGMIVGTPGYMSPEQSTGENALDGRSDLYALASVCYEMLAGEPPFTGPTAQAVIARRLAQPPPSLRTTRASIPVAVDTVVRRALAALPADRYASVTEFSQALDAARTAPEAMPGRRRSMLVGAGLLTVVLVVTTLLVRGTRMAPPAATDGIRLAVLPFRLIGNDTADQYLASGITEEVQAALSNLGGLRVIAQSSVAPVARRETSPRDIGAALRANALVEGELQRAGDAVRVRVRVIDPATEEVRWTRQYDHTARDVFLIQSEVASRIAGVLRIQLAERESHSLARPSTTNPEAYDAYLRGRSLGLPSTTPRARHDSAIAWLEQAVLLDSDFALARATLAGDLISSVFLFDADPGRLDQAEEHIRRALAKDSTLALAWKARSDLVWTAARGWHFPQALEYARRAITLQPSLVEAHNALGSLYFHYGFLDDALRELETSLSLDPRDGCDDPTRCQGFSRPRIARVLWYRQQFDSALALLNGMPYVGGFVWEQAVVLTALGRPAEAINLLDTTTIRPVAEDVDRRAARGLAWAALRDSARALGYLRDVAERPGSRSHFHHAQFTLACAYALLGRKADAVEWLRRTAENGMANYPLFRDDPNLQTLRGDSAYEALMAKLRSQHESYVRLVRAT